MVCTFFYSYLYYLLVNGQYDNRDFEDQKLNGHHHDDNGNFFNSPPHIFHVDFDFDFFI